MLLQEAWREQPHPSAATAPISQSQKKLFDRRMRITRAKKPSADLGAQPFHLGGSHAALSLTSLVICKCESRKVRSWYPERSFSGQREPVPASRGSPPLRLLHSLAVSSKVFGDNSTAQVKREPQREPFLLSSTATLLAVLAPWGKL